MATSRRKTKIDDASTCPETGSCASATAIQGRVENVDWTKVHADLDAQGWAVVPQLLTHAEADSISGLYHQEQGFRSQVIMGRYGFGRGEYKYFSYPLPLLIQELRTAAYPHFVPIANQWHECMSKEVRFPAAFLDRCHQAGQVRPTPLLLEYGPEDYNCLHRDLYGQIEVGERQLAAGVAHRQAAHPQHDASLRWPADVSPAYRDRMFSASPSSGSAHMHRRSAASADRLLLREIGSPDLRDRLHYQHPEPAPMSAMDATWTRRRRGPDWMPITPKTECLFHAFSQPSAYRNRASRD